MARFQMRSFTPASTQTLSQGNDYLVFTLESAANTKEYRNIWMVEENLWLFWLKVQIRPRMEIRLWLRDSEELFVLASRWVMAGRGSTVSAICLRSADLKRAGLLETGSGASR